MEGFVFDLQRFANSIPWPNVLTTGTSGADYFYTTTRNGNEFSIAAASGTNSQSTGTYYIRVTKTDNGANIGITKGLTPSENNATISLDFTGCSESSLILGIGDEDYKYNATLTKLPGGTVNARDKNITVSTKDNNTELTVNCNALTVTGTGNGHIYSTVAGTVTLAASASVASLKVKSGVNIVAGTNSNVPDLKLYNESGTANLTLSTGASVTAASVTLSGAGTATVTKAGDNSYSYGLNSGNFTLSGTSGYSLSDNGVSVSGTATITTNNKTFNVTSGTITMTGNGTANVANGAVVKVGTRSFTGSKANANSTLQVSSGNLTLTGGVFSYAGTDTLTLNSGAGVKYSNNVTYTAGANSTKCSYNNSNSKVTLTAGKLTCSAAATVIASSTEYSLTANSTISSGAVLSGGGVNLSNGKSITVSNTNGDKTSTIAAGSESSINVTVTDGTYVISGLSNGETVTLDGLTYTYNAATQRLLKDGMGWQLATDGTIGFTIANGTDTILANYGTAVAPDMKTELADIMTRLNSAGILYFSAAGIQQASADGAAYTLERDGSNYTLTSNANATTALTVDLAGVNGTNLTINFGTDGATAQNVKLDADTTLAGLTLGAGDSVLASDGTTVLAQAGNASGTVNVASGTVTALTGGSFVGVGTTTNTIDATSDVTIDGVTFAAGAEGTFTNGATDDADTFAVTAGTASIDSNFQGTTVTAHGVTYTVVPSSTVATFSGTTNTVTDFTSGKITFTAANETTYKIGNQTINDGNGATLTFVAMNTNTYLCSTGEGTISLSAEESITVSDENGANSKQIAAGAGSTIAVAVGTDGKYTISGLDDGEKVSIGGKHYLYHQDTNFLEEYDAGYQTGTGTGYILNENSSSISFTCDGNAGPGVLVIGTAKDMPTVLNGEGVLGTICRAMPAGATYYFGADGKRSDEQNAAYTLTKSTDGYTLTSNANANSDLNFVDASGLTNLKVDFSAGTGAQTLKVDSTTTLSSDSKLGAGDTITDGTNPLLTANAATTLSVAAGPDISVAPGANVTVPATPGIKTTGSGTYTVNGISVTTSGDSAPFIIIIPDADDATTLTLQNLAESETFTANTPGKNYTVGGQTFKNVSAGVEINGAGTATLTGTQSVTVPGTEGDTVVQSVSGDGIKVTITSGKYSISDLDDGEKVSIGGKTYLYRGNTGFLEELDGNDGTGRGYRLKPAGDNATIAFTNAGVLDTNTADALPGTMAGDAGQFAIVCSLVEENLPFQFKADGTRAVGTDPVAYTLTKNGSGYTLTSTDNANSDITLDTSGLTGLTVDLTAGTGAQTLKVGSTTTLSSGSKLGAGDIITDGTKTLLTAGSEVSLTKSAEEGLKVDLANGQSIKVPGTNGDTVIQSDSGNGVQVTLTDGKYTLSGLDNDDKVSIGGKTYLYHADTKFLEEYNETYPKGSGDGFILANDGSITFDSEGKPADNTAKAMPASLADEGALETICKAVPEGATNKYYFDKDGKRANPPDSAAYTLEKAEDGSYVLKSTQKCEGELPIDARGLTNLTVDFSEGSGQQVLKVDSETTLSPNTKLGAGDTITDGNNILVKASGDGGTVSVKEGTVTLNSGTFEGTGTNATPISATAPVTIDGVTFAEGAAGTFTNGTPDTFEVSKGQATIDKTFNGTEVKTKGVTYTVAPPTEATFDGATDKVTDFKSGKLTFTATDDKPYTIGGQTISDGNGEVLTFIAKDNKPYLCGTTNNHGGISLKPGESITVTDENGNNPTTIAPLENSTVNVSVTSGGKYTLSGLDDGEEVSIENKTSGEKKTYLYRKDTQFLEEFNETYPYGSGDGFILKDGSISFNNDGTLDEGTATSMPSSLAEKGALDIINRAMPEGNTYYFNEQGGRAESDKTAAYTLEKTSEKSVLKSTENSTGELPVDARGLTKLEVDFSAGDGKQTLDVDEKTELATGSTLGKGSSITYNGKPYVSGFTGDTPVLLAPGKPLTISDLTPGTTVDVAPGMEVKAGNAVYKAADKGTPLTIGKSTDGTGTIGVQSGTLVPTAGTAYTMLDSNGQKGDVVTVTGEAEITTDATGKAAVTGLDKVGEKVVIKNSEGQETTYEVIAENLIKKVDSEGNITHWTVTDSSQLTLTDEEGTTQGAKFKAALVATKDKTAEGETYLTANGVSTEAGKDDVAAVLTKDGNKKTLEVSKDMDLNVQLTGDTLTVKDKGTNTTYNLTDTTEISASGATFTTAEGVASDVTGTLTVKEGELDTKDGSDKAKYALSEGTKVNFQPGSPLSGTTVTTAKGNTIVIKESDNTNTTTVDSQGNLTGVDGNAEITGLPVGATVTTTGSGTIALNGKTWEVKGDSDGATFTVSSDGISGVTGLAEGATLSTADRVSDLTINGCTITRAKNGLSYTAGKGEFGLSHQGDSLRTADGTAFTVDKSQNGVSVGTDGKLTGLTDGEKVTVTTEDGTKLVYEVTGNTLVTTKTAPDGTITTMTSILAEGETGFAIEPGAMKAANGSTDASQILANADINAGSTEISPVSTVTNGMLLDKKGHATADSDKAIAEITIKDDGVLKYEATKEVRQTIKIGTGSTAEWDITTTNKADTIDYAGSHDVSITSRDGNDKITISGTGDAVVRGESGRNTIIHTGTGDATIVGGSGNDTITSTHADDTITGGEGKDTFILTNVESHVTDFTYGQDKAIITSSAGALDPYKVKVTTDGNISYTGAGAVSGSLNVDGQGYGDFYAATLADVDGHNKLNVGWTGAQGGMIDASSLTDKFLLLGNSEGSSDSLIGGQSRDTIVAGNGASSLWGGAGRDLIESNDEASHTIFFLAGDGNDTVKGFTAYGEDNADTLNFLGQGVTAVKHTDKGIQLYHGSDKMTLTGNYDANTMIQWENGDDHGIAKIGKTGEDNKFTYNEEVTSYLGSSGKDTLTIGDDVDNAEIWLDGSHGANYDSVEILDASSSNGTVILAGGEGKQTITGGKGNSSLWGGTGSATDVLNGGSGEDVFYYGKEEGNDIVNNASADDKVMLYNLSLGDLKAADIDTNKVTITQQNGQTLTINGRAGEFTLSDGSTWTADYSTRTWNRVK